MKIKPQNLVLVCAWYSCLYPEWGERQMMQEEIIAQYTTSLYVPLLRTAGQLLEHRLTLLQTWVLKMNSEETYSVRYCDLIENTFSQAKSRRLKIDLSLTSSLCRYMFAHCFRNVNLMLIRVIIKNQFIFLHVFCLANSAFMQQYSFRSCGLTFYKSH